MVHGAARWILPDLQGLARPRHTWHKQSMARPKRVKVKRDNRVVTYVRVKPEEHAQIVKIVAKRGLPHTIASVSAEMISRGLAATNDAGR